HRDEQAADGPDGIGERGAGRGHGDDRTAAPVGLLREHGQAGLGAVRGGDQQQVDGAGPAGQLPAQGTGGRGHTGGGQPGDGAAGAGERADQVGGMGGGGTRSGDQDGTRAAVGPEVAHAGLGGVPDGGADPGA